MRLTSLLLSTCAVLALAVPALAQGASSSQAAPGAIPQAHERHGGGHSDGAGKGAQGAPVESHGGRQAPGAAPAVPAAPLQAHRPAPAISPPASMTPQAGLHRNREGEGGERRREHVAPGASTFPARPAPPPRPRDQIRPPVVPPLGDWDRHAEGADRDHAGQRWRDQHRGWDQNAPWRQNREWWRRDRGFRLYFGPRLGFFFVPEFGYVAPPAEYSNRYWRPGDYLPSWFWRFIVRDYARYGLPEPPMGCAWVWVDNDVALIQLSDGYILDIVHNAW